MWLRNSSWKYTKKLFKNSKFKFIKKNGFNIYILWQNLHYKKVLYEIRQNYVQNL